MYKESITELKKRIKSPTRIFVINESIPTRTRREFSDESKAIFPHTEANDPHDADRIARDRILADQPLDLDIRLGDDLVGRKKYSSHILSFTFE